MTSILLVDDERSLLLSMAEGLEAFVPDFKVHTASNGKEAMEVFDHREVDILVTDLRMPEVEGFELLEWACAKKPGLPAIVLSAFVTPRIEEKLKEMGAWEVLVKPLDFKMLAASIQSIMDRRGEGPPGAAPPEDLPGLLVHLEKEGSSALVDVRGAGGAGYFLVSRGEVLDAACGRLSGEEAALCMLRWEDAASMVKPPPAERFERNIFVDADTLVRRALGSAEEAAKPMDEAGRLTASDLDFLARLRDPAQPRDPDRRERPPASEPSLDSKTSRALTEILAVMAEDLEQVGLLAVVDFRGGVLASHGPWSREKADLGSGLAHALDRVRLVVVGAGLGSLEEMMVETSEAWVLVRRAGAEAFLALALGKDATLGNARMVAGRYAESVAGQLSQVR
ncbi:MAG: response regulator [Deltaproteobacteria bacterium]|nr:response regulator [Deltaproteobacteria bacterium]